MNIKLVVALALLIMLVVAVAPVSAEDIPKVSPTKEAVQELFKGKDIQKHQVTFATAKKQVVGATEKTTISLSVENKGKEEFSKIKFSNPDTHTLYTFTSQNSGDISTLAMEETKNAPVDKWARKQFVVAYTTSDGLGHIIRGNL